MRKSIWDEVKELTQAGKTGFQIQITPGELVESRKRRGHPRVRDPISPFKHFADPRVRLNGGKSKPRCVREGCRKLLKRDDILVCSTECEQMERERVLQTLKYLDLRAERLQKGLIKSRRIRLVA